MRAESMMMRMRKRVERMRVEQQSGIVAKARAGWEHRYLAWAASHRI